MLVTQPKQHRRTVKKPRHLCRDQSSSQNVRHLQTNLPKILCIDDDPDIQTIVEMRLKPLGVQVERAFHGMQGIAEASRSDPQLILLDLAMPNGCGLEVLESIKSKPSLSQIPVIVLTGMRDPMLLKTVRAAGAERILPKPIEFGRLLGEITRLLDLPNGGNEGIQ